MSSSAVPPQLLKGEGGEEVSKVRRSVSPSAAQWVELRIRRVDGCVHDERMRNGVFIFQPGTACQLVHDLTGSSAKDARRRQFGVADALSRSRILPAVAAVGNGSSAFLANWLVFADSY